MLPVSTSVTSMTMEDAEIYRSHQQFPAPSAVKVIKATDFSIAAIIGSSKPAKPLITSPVESPVKPLSVFNFGKSSFYFGLFQ